MSESPNDIGGMSQCFVAASDGALDNGAHLQ